MIASAPRRARAVDKALRRHPGTNSIETPYRKGLSGSSACLAFGSLSQRAVSHGGPPSLLQPDHAVARQRLQRRRLDAELAEDFGVCSPRFGAGRRSWPGVSDRRGMMLCIVMRPVSASGMFDDDLAHRARTAGRRVNWSMS